MRAATRRTTGWRRGPRCAAPDHRVDDPGILRADLHCGVGGAGSRGGCPGDRRARFAALTEDGERLLRGIFPEHAAAIRDALATLGPDDKREAIRLLRLVIDAAPDGT